MPTSFSSPDNFRSHRQTHIKSPTFSHKWLKNPLMAKCRRFLRVVRQPFYNLANYDYLCGDVEAWPTPTYAAL